MDINKILSEKIADDINNEVINNLINNDKKDEPIKLIKQTGYSSSESIKGFVIQLGSKFWGILYEDGRSKEYGWVDLKHAEIYKKINQPEDATYENSPYIAELKKATLVEVTVDKIIDYNLKY